MTILEQYIECMKKGDEVALADRLMSTVFFTIRLL